MGSNLICFLVICIWLQLAIATPYRDRYYDRKCTDTETGRELFMGEVFTRPGLCIRVQCLGNLQLWEDRCEEPKLEGNCTRLPPANEFLDYPLCCPLYQCKIYTRNQNGQTEETRTYDHYGSLRLPPGRQYVSLQITLGREYVEERNKLITAKFINNK